MNLPKFVCPNCNNELIDIPKLFPKAILKQEKPLPSAICSICNWEGDMKETIRKW